jgi:glycosyltransferase involved in cell wall biosynthesis
VAISNTTLSLSSAGMDKLKAISPSTSSITPTISVVVPVFNETSTLPQIVSRLQQLPFELEIIVIDDGSERIAAEQIDNLPNGIVVLRHAVNQGKGAALRSGFAVATGELVVVQDADLEYSPEEIPDVIAPILRGEADVVYGSRFAEADENLAPLIRRMANHGLTWLSNRLTGLRLTDMETGHKAFRREVLDGFCIQENRFGVEPEITAKVAKAGWRVTEVPISYAPRSYADGKKIGWRDGVRALWCIVRYR